MKVHTIYEKNQVYLLMQIIIERLNYKIMKFQGDEVQVVIHIPAYKKALCWLHKTTWPTTMQHQSIKSI